MKFGIHAGLWQKAWTDDILPILETAADIGFDGIEISLLGVGLDDAARIGERARSLGLELTCSTGLGTDADPGSADAATREAGQRALEEAITVTSALGARVLCGVVASPWGFFEPERKAERARLAGQTLAALDGVLAEKDVVLAIEALNRFETDLTNTGEEARAVAAASGSDRVGVLLDTFHMNMEEKVPADAIRRCGDKLLHFHVSDNDRGVPGSGHFDFPAAAEALKGSGYDGWVVAEMFVMAGNPASRDVSIWRDIEPDPGEAARQALAYMRRVFS